MINELLSMKKDLEELGREEGIEGVEDRIQCAMDNYKVAHWREYPDNRRLQVIFNALAYGVEAGSRYIQERLVERKNAVLDDAYQNMLEIPLGDYDDGVGVLIRFRGHYLFGLDE